MHSFASEWRVPCHHHALRVHGDDDRAYDFQTYALENARMVIVGTKCDLAPEHTLVSEERGQEFGEGAMHRHLCRRR